MRWSKDQLTAIDVVADSSGGDVITATIDTPSGRITVMASIDFAGRCLIAKGLHMHSSAGALSFGVGNLHLIA